MFYYLDEVCEEIKYKTIHKEIRKELQSHIDEFAEEYGEVYGRTARDMAKMHMGNAKELGEMIDRQYPMPFNSKWGLAIWAAVNTVLGWMLYPIWMDIWKHSTKIATPVACGVFIYCILNMLFLRRTHFKCSFRDWGHIALGTIAGSVLSVGALLCVSAAAGNFGYYTYGARCVIPYIWHPWLYEMPMMFFFFWVMWIMYMLSLSTPKGWKKRQLKILPYVLPGEALNMRESEYCDVYGNKRKYSDIVNYGTAMKSIRGTNGSVELLEWRDEAERKSKWRRGK